MSNLLGIAPEAVNGEVSRELLRTVIAQRSVKTDEEIRELEEAVRVSGKMHRAAMAMAAPGIIEREIVGIIASIAYAESERPPGYPIIFSVDGQTLHNHSHANRMKEGDLIVHDSGADSPMGYAGDITRTIPVSGRFTGRQKDIYNIVLRMQDTAMGMIKPGVAYRDVHLAASRRLAADAIDMGLYSGDADAVVESGAHALLFPHGLGHMLGLDVHDMEALGEDLVGYDTAIQRSPQFGLSNLRLGKALEAGFVITVEPGLYFIPQLFHQWRAEGKFKEFINYDRIEAYLDFGGVRLEDDVLVTEEGARVLGQPIPRTIDEVEACCAEAESGRAAE